ncbi:transposase [Pilimelia columellifera]|uniref:Transposase n=1 Tax=Pilimelia columellifera subsp. columellifera TaxID=706583 RepID=A0ABN3NJI4_9ACTN
MTLVRVYCGLAAAEWSSESPVAGASLTAAVVDDAGRLLDIYEITDDADGYAALTALLAERSTGDADVPIAVQRGDRIVASLASAAGRPLALTSDDAAADYAERFSDDESAEETQAPEIERRAIGLARALQAGALWATTVPAPADLVACRPLLVAYGALTAARQAAAVALREVLREVYPAALRAFADPTSALCLAIINEFPEPGLARGSDGDAHDIRALADQLASAQIADAAEVGSALTALRVAAAESGAAPRATTPEVTAFVIRQAIGAVRAQEAAQTALVGAIDRHLTQGRQPANVAPAAPAATAAAPTADDPLAVGGPSGNRAGRLTTPPTRRRPTAGVAYSIEESLGALPKSAPSPRVADPAAERPDTAGRRRAAPGQRPTPADIGQPFRAEATKAEIDRTRAERLAHPSAPLPPRPTTPRQAGPDDPAEPTPRAAARANWPLQAEDSADSDLARPFRDENSRPPLSRVKPPWQSDDLPPEPPALRLVDQSPPSSTGSANGYGSVSGPQLRSADESRRLAADDPLPSPFGADGDGDLLIFAATRSAWFTGRDAAASDVSWTFIADSGWRAAEQAAQPSIGVRTTAGLPRRVPKANLVPGSPEQQKRPLRIVRDAASIAAHTTGYFSGWRRGQEIGGYAVGGRPGRDSASGWDFSRAPHDDEGGDYRAATHSGA